MNETGTSMYMPVAPAYGGGFGGFGGDMNSGWWVILLVLLMGGGLWGGGFGGNGGGFVGADVQRGFDQSAVMNGMTGIQSSLTNGFADVQNGFAQSEIAANSRQMADMNQYFAGQTAILQGFNNVQGQLAQCCCDNRLATTQTQNVVQTEGAATRSAIQSGVQMILDKMCQDKIDAKNEKIVELNNRINSLEANNYIQNALTAQTQFILNRYPVPDTAA